MEGAFKNQPKLKPNYQVLLSVPGIGEILGLTIMLETGDIQHFTNAGQYASYCRCVGSTRISNGKQKGKGNSKNGNKHLAWAFVEAANFAIRYNDRIKGSSTQSGEDQPSGGEKDHRAQTGQGLLLHNA